MTNIEKFNQAFIEVFGVEESALGSAFAKENVDSWDSVHQLTSYDKGVALMGKYEVEL